MFINRELSLKVSKGIWSNIKHFWIDEDVTVLTKSNEVIIGSLKDINLDNLIIKKPTIDVLVYFKDIEKIENTDWLGDEDIREV